MVPSACSFFPGPALAFRPFPQPFRVPCRVQPLWGPGVRQPEKGCTRGFPVPYVRVFFRLPYSETFSDEGSLDKSARSRVFFPHFRLPVLPPAGPTIRSDAIFPAFFVLQGLPSSTWPSLGGRLTLKRHRFPFPDQRVELRRPVTFPSFSFSGCRCTPQ